MADAASPHDGGGAGVDAGIKEMWQGEMEEMQTGQEEVDEFALTVSTIAVVDV